MPFVYILRSLKDNKYYYGSTKNVEQRLNDHNKGKVKSTKGRCPLIIHYFEEFYNTQDARSVRCILKALMDIVG
jgi:putative endonuclease